MGRLRLDQYIERTYNLMAIYIRHPNGIRDRYAATLSGIPPSTLCEMRHRLPGMFEVSPGYWTIIPSEAMKQFAQAIYERKDL